MTTTAFPTALPITSNLIDELVSYMYVPAYRFPSFSKALPVDLEDDLWRHSRLGSEWNLPGNVDIYHAPQPDEFEITPDLVEMRSVCSIFSRSHRDARIAELSLQSYAKEQGLLEGDSIDWSYCIRRVEFRPASTNASLGIPKHIKLIKIEDVLVNAHGKTTRNCSDLMGWTKKSRYFPVSNSLKSNPEWTSTRKKHIICELMMMFGLQYEWVVRIGYSGCGSIILPTCPELLCDLFATRDVPAGKKRRDAMLHWVSAHQRRKTSDPEAVVEVRRHLRGSHQFNWDGFEVVVKPSRPELEQLGNTKKAGELLGLE